MIHLCTGLVKIAGSHFKRACRRRVNRPLGACDQCRPEAPRKPSKGPSAEYQRDRRARLAQAGVMPGWEAVG